MKHRIKEDKGGLTIEATLILPIFIMFIIMFVYIIQTYYIYGNINIAMYSAAGQLSSEISNLDLITESNAREKVVENLNSKVCEIIFNGVEGIDTSNSFYDGTKQEIYLKSRYAISMPINILRTGNYNVANNIVIRSWTGNKDLITNKNFVYVTKTGKVYHTDINCSYLCIKKISINREEINEYRNEGGAKYYECKECKDEKNSKYVYITKYGISYHNIKMCSSITRTIIPIDIHELEGREKCEKCCK